MPKSTERNSSKRKAAKLHQLSLFNKCKHGVKMSGTRPKRFCEPTYKQVVSMVRISWQMSSQKYATESEMLLMLPPRFRKLSSTEVSAQVLLFTVRLP